MVLPLIAGALSALGGAEGIGSILGMTVAPALIEHMMTSGPDAEGQAKIKDTIDRLAMQHAQEQGIGLDAARKQVTDQLEPALTEAFSKKPGVLTDVLSAVGGAMVGHKLGGVVGKRFGKKAAVAAAAAPAAATVAAEAAPRAAESEAAEAITGTPAKEAAEEATETGRIASPDEDILAQLMPTREATRVADPDILAGLGYPSLGSPAIRAEYATEHIRPPTPRAEGFAAGRGFTMAPQRGGNLGMDPATRERLLVEAMRQRMYGREGD